jgi:hypothetical protein
MTYVLVSQGKTWHDFDVKIFAKCGGQIVFYVPMGRKTKMKCPEM